MISTYISGLVAVGIIVYVLIFVYSWRLAGQKYFSFDLSFQLGIFITLLQSFVFSLFLPLFRIISFQITSDTPEPRLPSTDLFFFRAPQGFSGQRLIDILWYDLHPLSRFFLGTILTMTALNCFLGLLIIAGRVPKKYTFTILMVEIIRVSLILVVISIAYFQGNILVSQSFVASPYELNQYYVNYFLKYQFTYGYYILLTILAILVVLVVNMEQRMVSYVNYQAQDSLYPAISVQMKEDLRSTTNLIQLEGISGLLSS